MIELQLQIIKLIKKHRPDCKQFRHVLREIRRRPDIKEILGFCGNKPERLPYVPKPVHIKKLLDNLQHDGKLKYRLMIQILIYTGLRSFELLNLKVQDIDLDTLELSVMNGKGGIDNKIILWRGLKEALIMYMAAIPHNIYLFENRNHQKYSTRFLRKIFQHYREKAGLKEIHAHSLRHFIITHMKNEGLQDWMIQHTISRHKDIKNLQIYQHLALKPYQETVQNVLDRVGL